MSQDIIRKSPEFKRILSTVNDRDKIRLLKNSRYSNLLKVIHNLGNTADLSSIAEEFSNLLSKNQNIDDNQGKISKKSTVYRSIQELMKSEYNFIMESGQRITPGVTAVKNLYSLTSEFVLIDEQEVDWESTKGKNLFKEIINILRMLFPNKPIDEVLLYNWHLQFTEMMNTYKSKLLSSTKPKILDLLSVWSILSINDIIEYIGWIAINFSNNRVQEEFLSCFSKDKIIFDDFTVSDEREQDSSKIHQIIRKWPSILGKYPISIINERFRNISYLPLIEAFQDSILTMDEAINRYNELSLVERNQSTIYNYTRDLKEDGLLEEVGQLYVEGQKATKKLYTLKSRILTSIETINWETDHRQWIIDTSIEILKYIFPELPSIDREKYQKFRVETTKYELECVQLMENIKDNLIVKILYKYNFADFWTIYTSILDFYYFLSIENIHKSFNDCLIS